MDTSWYEAAEKYMHGEFSYPFAYGAFSAEARAFLKDETSRDHFTAFFAQMDMLHQHYVEQMQLGSTTEQALVTAIELSKALVAPRGRDATGEGGDAVT